MPTKLAEIDQMTVEEFLAFYDARPLGEKWELIEGVAAMSPSPTNFHQRIIQNLSSALDEVKLKQNAEWVVFLGISLRVPISPHSLPQPDLYVAERAGEPTAVTNDALVIFEVLSPSNTKADQAWRRRMYSSVPNCQHYVAVAGRKPEITRYDRANNWSGVTISGLEATLDLPALNAALPLAQVYRWTNVT
jgi:Uma2 family endonuclease